MNSKLSSIIIVFILTVLIYKFVNYQMDFIGNACRAAVKESKIQLKNEAFNEDVFDNKRNILELLNYVNHNYRKLIDESNKNKSYHYFKTQNLENKLDSFSYFNSKLSNLEIESIRLGPENGKGLGLRLGIHLKTISGNSIAHSIVNRKYNFENTTNHPYPTIGKDSILIQKLYYLIEVSPYTY